jgi:hypothetical protein
VRNADTKSLGYGIAVSYTNDSTDYGYSFSYRDDSAYAFSEPDGNGGTSYSEPNTGSGGPSRQLLYSHASPDR